VNEAAGAGGYRVAMDEPCSLMGRRFAPDTILLCVEEKGDGGGREKGFVRGVPWDDAVLIMELDISKAELSGASVRRCLGVFTRSEAEKEGELDEVGGAGCAL